MQAPSAALPICPLTNENTNTTNNFNYKYKYFTNYKYSLIEGKYGKKATHRYLSVEIFVCGDICLWRYLSVEIFVCGDIRTATKLLTDICLWKY